MKILEFHKILCSLFHVLYNLFWGDVQLMSLMWGTKKCIFTFGERLALLLIILFCIRNTHVLGK
jgi:hypothetical protein